MKIKYHCDEHGKFLVEFTPQAASRVLVPDTQPCPTCRVDSPRPVKNRVTISVSRATYKRMEEHKAATGTSISQIVEQSIKDVIEPQ